MQRPWGENLVKEYKTVRADAVKKGREMRHGGGGGGNMAINSTAHPIAQWLLQALSSTRPSSELASQPAPP